MANKIIKGRDLMLFDDKGKSFAYATNHTLTMTAETSDISSKDHGIWSATEVSKYTWEITSENLFTENAYANMFDAMIDDIRESTVRDILTFFPAPKREVKIVRQQVAKPLIEGFDGGKPVPRRTPAAQKVGRNDLCPCGSGKKYKKCCGANDRDGG